MLRVNVFGFKYSNVTPLGERMHAVSGGRDGGEEGGGGFSTQNTQVLRYDDQGSVKMDEF